MSNVERPGKRWYAEGRLRKMHYFFQGESLCKQLFVVENLDDRHVYRTQQVPKADRCSVCERLRRKR
jgi:hypothetical protein